MSRRRSHIKTGQGDGVLQSRLNQLEEEKRKAGRHQHDASLVASGDASERNSHLNFHKVRVLRIM